MEKLLKLIEETGKITLSDEFKKNLTEAIENMKAVAVSEKEVIVEESKKLLGEAKTEIEKLQGELKAAKENIVTESKQSIEDYKAQLVEKLSSFMDAELKTLVPENVEEALAKVQIFEPIMESVKKTFNTYGVEFKSEGYELLKEAKAELEVLKKKSDENEAKNIELVAEMAKIAAEKHLNEKCEGLTAEQVAKMKVIFKNKSVSEIDEKFTEIRDLIVEKKEEKKEEVKPVVTEEVKTSVVIEEKVEDLGQRLI